MLLLPMLLLAMPVRGLFRRMPHGWRQSCSAPCRLSRAAACCTRVPLLWAAQYLDALHARWLAPGAAGQAPAAAAAGEPGGGGEGAGAEAARGGSGTGCGSNGGAGASSGPGTSRAGQQPAGVEQAEGPGVFASGKRDRRAVVRVSSEAPVLRLKRPGTGQAGTRGGAGDGLAGRAAPAPADDLLSLLSALVALVPPPHAALLASQRGPALAALAALAEQQCDAALDADVAGLQPALAAFRGRFACWCPSPPPETGRSCRLALHVA